jgi:hypothetical protein
MDRRPIRATVRALGRRGRTYATASVMRRRCARTAASVPIVCKRNAGRSTIRNCMPIASRASASRRLSLPGGCCRRLPLSRPTVDDLAVADRTSGLASAECEQPNGESYGKATAANERNGINGPGIRSNGERTVEHPDHDELERSSIRQIWWVTPSSTHRTRRSVTSTR